MSSAATEAEILAGVERWARARKYCSDTGDYAGDWQVEPRAHAPRDGTLAIWAAINDQARGLAWRVRPALALAWALTVETEPEPVDVGRCPACVARSLPGRKLATVEWFAAWDNSGSRLATERHYRENDKKGRGAGWKTLLCQPHDTRPSEGVNGTSQPWLAARRAREPDPRWFYLLAWRPCPTCSGTGRETVPLARLLLDTVNLANDAVGNPPGFPPGIYRTSDLARMRLLVHADHLQAKGDTLGGVVGLALGPWSGEPDADAGPCPRCHGTGEGYPTAHGPFEKDGRTEFIMTTPACSACAGFGFLRGHPGTAEALRWLEWLTWAREFERDNSTMFCLACGGAHPRHKKAARVWRSNVPVGVTLAGCDCHLT